MANFRVKITGFKEFEKEQIFKINKISQEQLSSISKETEVVIQKNITQSLVRPGSTGNLASNFVAEIISNRSWGVGNISSLDRNAPYWRHVNYGSVAIGANWNHRVPQGQFSPGIAKPDPSAFRSGKWSVGSGNYSFISTKPIEPHNFIQRTLTEIPRIITSNLRLIKGF